VWVGGWVVVVVVVVCVCGGGVGGGDKEGGGVLCCAEHFARGGTREATCCEFILYTITCAIQANHRYTQETTVLLTMPTGSAVL
jgi:hypothetical protein